MFEFRFVICLVCVLGFVALSQATTEPLPELVAKEKRELKAVTETETAAVANKEAEASALLAVDAGDEHASSTNREARQFGFGRGFGFGGFRRPFYGGFRPYGFYRPPPFYGGFYRPYYRPPPFFYRPYYGFGPGFYG